MNRMILALMLFSAAPALAHERMDERAAVGRHEMEERMVARLGLDPQAAARFRQTIEKYGDRLTALRQTARATRVALKEELARPQPDRAAVTRLNDQLESDRGQARALWTERRAELKAQLTPEQYGRLLTARHGRMHHGRVVQRRAS
jgi:Spy/CpxP family protein refolding chaperone